MPRKPENNLLVSLTDKNGLGRFYTTTLWTVVSPNLSTDAQILMKLRRFIAFRTNSLLKSTTKRLIRKTCIVGEKFSTRYNSTMDYDQTECAMGLTKLSEVCTS